MPHTSDIPLPTVCDYIPDTTFDHQPNDSTSCISDPIPSSINTQDRPSPSVTPNSSEHVSENTFLNAPEASTNHHEIISNSSALPPPLRRSTRSHKPPTHLQDFFCGMVQITDFFAEFHALHAQLEQYTEPKSYEEAAKKPEWIQAIQKEIEALNNNNTWDLVDLPAGKRAISSKWVYKVKFKSGGTLERFKARLVIRGFTQQYGVYY